jgi:hypothetical protein
VPPSTRTATGSLPSRSRSSYSWGSDAQAPGQQTGDRLARTASNAATVRALQATPQVRGNIHSWSTVAQSLQDALVLQQLMPVSCL